MSPTRPLHETQSQPSHAGVDPCEVGPEFGPCGDVSLFRYSSEARLIIRTLIAHPAFRVSVLADRTLVCVERGDWWAFSHCGHVLGCFTSESGARVAECRACLEVAVSERWAGLFLDAVRGHASSLASNHGNPKSTDLKVGFRG